MKILSLYDKDSSIYKAGILDGGRHAKCGVRLHWYNDMLICERCTEVINLEFSVEKTYDPKTRGEVGA